MSKIKLDLTYLINLFSEARLAIISFLLFLIIIVLPAQEDQNKLFNNPVISDETMARFLKITEKLRENKIVRAEFKQTKSIKALKRPLISEGQFLIAQTKGLYFDTKKPFEQLTVITADYLIQKDSGGNFSQLKSDSHPLLQKSTESFLAIFSGNSMSIKENYNIFIFEENSEWQIGLKPKTNNENKEYIGSIIFKGGKYLNSLYMEEKLGNTTIIEFTNHRIDQNELTSEEMQKFELKK